MIALNNTIYGKNIDINDITICGNAPTYYNMDGTLNGLTTFLKNDTSTKDIETIKLNTTSVDNMIGTPQAINPITNTKWTVNDLKNTQFGVRSKKA
jgi:hypothetical protein